MSAAAGDAIQRFLAHWAEIADLSSASAVLSWDQETMMPPRGIEARGAVLATLAGLRHERLCAGALGDALEAAAEEAGPGGEAALQLRAARRERDRALRVPVRLAKELAQAQSRALAAWQAARKARDFAAFAPDLEHMVALVREKADALNDGGDPYDALLDEFEPDARIAAVEPLMEELRAAMVPLIRAVAEDGRPVDESPARGDFPAERQRAFGVFVARAFGFDFDAGRLDAAAHPFCTSFGTGDVRLTWRWSEEDFRPALFGLLHETGHGLYEQGLPAAWERTPLGAAVGLGVHESQSRLWENRVGRSRAFWRWAAPHFAEHFPGHAADPDALYPALHTCRPSLIRVEADEATYDLHVIARMRIERRLIGGGLEVGELPEAWNGTYEELLGVRPRHDGEGVLQDIHWAMGAFGYFPTYTLGNLASAQFYAAAAEDLGSLEEDLARGEFGGLLEWLREQVHRHGRAVPAPELIERATGKPLGVDALVAHLHGVMGEVYGVSPPARSG